MGYATQMYWRMRMIQVLQHVLVRNKMSVMLPKSELQEGVHCIDTTEPDTDCPTVQSIDVPHMLDTRNCISTPCI